MSSDLHTRTIAELGKLLDAGKCSSVELTQHFLARIDAHGKALNAFITVTPERALAQAKAADARRALLKKSGEQAGPLLGIPFAHKVNDNGAQYFAYIGKKLHPRLPLQALPLGHTHESFVNQRRGVQPSHTAGLR